MALGAVDRLVAGRAGLGPGLRDHRGVVVDHVVVGDLGRRRLVAVLAVGPRVAGAAGRVRRVGGSTPDLWLKTQSRSSWLLGRWPIRTPDSVAPIWGNVWQVAQEDGIVFLVTRAVDDLVVGAVVTAEAAGRRLVAEVVRVGRRRRPSCPGVATSR